MVDSSEGEETQTMNGQQIIMPQTQRQDSLDLGWVSNNNITQTHKEGADDQLWDDLEILFDMMEHDQTNGILV